MNRTLAQNTRPGGDPRPVGWPEEGPKAAWIEPNWDAGRTAPAQAAPAAPAQQGERPSPFALWDQDVAGQIKLLTSQSETMSGQVQGSIKNVLDISYAQYNLSADSLDKQGLDPQTKARRLEQLNTQYQKMWVEIKGKIKPDLDEIGAKTQATIDELKFKASGTREVLGYIQGMMDRGEITREEGLTRQFTRIGKPQLAPQPKPKEQTQTQTPKQELTELSPVLRSMEQELNMYTTPPAAKGKRLFGKVRSVQDLGRGSLKILKEEARTSENMRTPMAYLGNEELVRDATPEEEARFWALRRYVQPGQSREQQLRTQVFGRHVPGIAFAAQQEASPFAQGVTTQQQTESNDVSKLSDAELRRIAGM
ncbi:hypothetical protein IMZ48_26215 [Candidatus Bathyarchaeota archaeon]|nr:hypothetical protein [Candidatus Bathyarchaeota archaeon]